MKFSIIAQKKSTWILPLFLFVGLHSQVAQAGVSLAGPSLTYGQNLDQDDQLFLGGWGLFLGSQFRLGLAAYTHLTSYNPSGGSADDFQMYYGGAMLMYALNPSVSTPVEFNVGMTVGGGRVTIPSLSTAENFWMIEPTVLALLRLNPWFGLGLDIRYRYVPTIDVGAQQFSNLSGFLAGISLVFGSGDGR